MTEKVIRFPDPDQRSRNPDAMQPRDPCEATIIILPTVKVERFPKLPRRRRLPSVFGREFESL